MEPLTIEDLKNLLDVITHYLSITTYRKQSLLKSRGIIEQMIKDKEFERESKPLPF